MKFKESNKQKFYMRNVYINQIMKPQIQNNLNYAYFENPNNIMGYYNNQNLGLNTGNIFFNNKPIKTFYQNYIPKQNMINKDSSSYRKNDIESEQNFYNENFNNFNQTNTLGGNYKKNKVSINERSFSENRINKLNKTYNVLKKKDRKEENLSYLKVKQINKNGRSMKKDNKNVIDNNINFDEMHNIETILKNSTNENISSGNTNSNSSLKSNLKSKDSLYNERNKMKNNIMSKYTYFADDNKIFINQNQNIINRNNACATSPNNNISQNSKINENKNIKNSNKNSSIGKTNIKSYKYFAQKQFFKGINESNPNNNINYINYSNNYNSPNRQQDENINNISTFNSPSVPSYSSIIDDNSINSKNYVWIKKNIKNSKLDNNIENNKIYNYNRKPNINKENTISQNIINVANDITDITSSLYNTEIIYQDMMNNQTKKYEEKDLFEHSAILIQSVFRGFLIKKKFYSFYHNYKYYYNKGIELLELILNYFFQKKINIIAEKKKFFNYLISVKKEKSLNNKNRKKNKISQKPKSYKNFKISSNPFSPPNINNKSLRYFQDLFLHKEIGERFNIIKGKSKETDNEKRYKDKLEGVNIKLNKLIKENNILKNINKTNKIKENKYLQMSQDIKKKDDIINIIMNDNKTLARKLKIIQDKFNKLQIQNQDYINYNSDNEQYNKNRIDLFEEYRNLFLEYLIHKLNEKFYSFILRKSFYKFMKNSLSLKTNEIINQRLKEQTLRNLLDKRKNKINNLLKHNLIQFYYKSKINKKEIENRNNIIKGKLLSIFKRKENINNSFLKKYFYKLYYKGIISKIKEEKNNNKFIHINRDSFESIKNFLKALLKRQDRYNKNIKREYFIKWHLYTKVLSLKALINDKRRKKRQKQKLKKKSEIEATNNYLNNNKILHFGKSNIYILNKDKERQLLISLDTKEQNNLTKNENSSIDNKYNNVIQATRKLKEIFYKAAEHHQFLYRNIEIKDSNKNKIIINDNKDNNKDNNNIVEEEEDSGDSFGL